MDEERRLPENARLREVINDLRDKCMAATKQNTLDIARIRRILVWLVSLVIVVLIAVGAASFYFRGQDSARADEAKRTAEKTQLLAIAIQQDRVDTCKDNKQRRAKLDKVLAAARKRAKTKAQQAQINLFAESVAPARDCAPLIRTLHDLTETSP